MPGGERVGRLHREARAEQADVERDVADRDGARRGVADGLAEAEILEEIAGAGLAHDLLTDKPVLTPNGAWRRIITNP